LMKYSNMLLNSLKRRLKTKQRKMTRTKN